MSLPNLIDISSVLSRARAFLASIPAETEALDTTNIDIEKFEEVPSDQDELFCMRAMKLHPPEQLKTFADADGESDSEEDFEEEKGENPATDIATSEADGVYIPPDQVDLVITVRISITTSRNASNRPAQLQLLSSQSLGIVLSKLPCLTEWAVENIVGKAAKNPHDVFFLIENCFYDDELEPGKRPSDKYYHALLKARPETVESLVPSLSRDCNVKRASLLHTRWQDIKVRMNQPYLLVHYGFCQHQVTVTDIRIHNTKMDPPPSAFPRILQAPRTRHKRCRVCECYYATHMTVDDKLAPENPCYWCDTCFKDFHQRPDTGEFWYTDFKHFPYKKDS